jgi:hypothetical protein
MECSKGTSGYEDGREGWSSPKVTWALVVEFVRFLCHMTYWQYGLSAY